MKIGDVVALKSGGPNMTVINTSSITYIGGGVDDTNLMIYCVWFYRGMCKNGEFPEFVLTEGDLNNGHV